MEQPKHVVQMNLDRITRMGDEDLKLNGDLVRSTAGSALSLIRKWNSLLYRDKSDRRRRVSAKCAK